MKISPFFRKTYSLGDRCPVRTFAPAEAAFPDSAGSTRTATARSGSRYAAWTPPPRALLRTPDTLRPRRAGAESLDHPDLLELLQRLDGTRHAFDYPKTEDLRTVRAVPRRKIIASLDDRRRHHAMTRPARIFKNSAPRLQQIAKIGERPAQSPFRLGSGSSSFVGPAKMPQSGNARSPNGQLVNACRSDPPDPGNPASSPKGTVASASSLRDQRPHTSGTYTPKHCEQATCKADAAGRERTGRGPSKNAPASPGRKHENSAPFHRTFTRRGHCRAGVQRSEIQRGERPRFRRRSPNVFPCGKAGSGGAGRVVHHW